jgi:catechol 2,3-dioxygenase-like lactoylglutathione lyase family enzyme
MKLRRAMIFAKDMTRMTAFYRDGLGLRLIPENRREDWVEFEAGGCLLALHAVPVEISKDIAIASPPEPRADTPMKLVFETPDLRVARSHLLSKGAVMHEPRSSSACDGLDPEGNVFQIVEVAR